jgi:hypothetical protein
LGAIAEKCKIGSGPQNDWYFFSHKDKKYPTGTRTNRATAAGFWKATGRDKAIYNAVKRIGMRKTLVFYKGRAPHGQKSDWIMHEYRLEDPPSAAGADANATSMVRLHSSIALLMHRSPLIVFCRNNYTWWWCNDRSTSVLACSLTHHLASLSSSSSSSHPTLSHCTND